MTNWTHAISKGMLGTVAVGAMALASATPALADDHRDRGGISAGEIIAGAVVIGGIAALAGAFDGDKDRDWDDRHYDDRRYDDRRYDDRRYDNRRFAYNDGFRGISPRGAVERCVRAAENQALRFGGWRYADVTQVRDVDATRRGFRVEGRIEVQGNPRLRDRFERGRFTCVIDGGGRPFVDFDGIRGLR